MVNELNNTPITNYSNPLERCENRDNISPDAYYTLLIFLSPFISHPIADQIFAFFAAAVFALIVPILLFYFETNKLCRSFKKIFISFLKDADLRHYNMLLFLFYIVLIHFEISRLALPKDTIILLQHVIFSIGAFFILASTYINIHSFDLANICSDIIKLIFLSLLLCSSQFSRYESANFYFTIIIIAFCIIVIFPKFVRNIVRSIKCCEKVK